MPRAANAASGKKRQVHPKFEDPRPTLASLARLVQKGARGTGVICGGACWGEHALRSGLTNKRRGAHRETSPDGSKSSRFGWDVVSTSICRSRSCVVVDTRVSENHAATVPDVV